MAIQFNAAGGGLMGVLSVLKLIGQTALASPLTAIVAMAAQFVNLYENSEMFRDGLSRLWEIGSGVFGAFADILEGVFTVLGDIGSAILNLFPESVKTFILNGIQTIQRCPVCSGHRFWRFWHYDPRCRCTVCPRRTVRRSSSAGL